MKRKPNISLNAPIDEDSKLEDVLPVVLHHHESWDGNGYPQQLDAERIPLAARIVAVADAFDAMSSDRPYRKRMSNEKVDEILRAGAGRQWDPAVIDAFFRSSDDLRRLGTRPGRPCVRPGPTADASEPKHLTLEEGIEVVRKVLRARTQELREETAARRRAQPPGIGRHVLGHSGHRRV